MADFSSPFVGMLEGVSASISSLRTAAVVFTPGCLTYDEVGPAAAAITEEGLLQGTGGGYWSGYLLREKRHIPYLLLRHHTGNIYSLTRIR